MLYTNLNHIETASQYAQIINENQNAIIICGRMDYESIKAYRIAEELKENFKEVKFYDMELDNPATTSIEILSDFFIKNESPVILIYKEGELIESIEGNKSEETFTELLNNQFKVSVNLN